MNKKNNKIIIPLLVLVAFIGGSVWTYLVINQLNRGTTNSVTKGGNYTINENSISGAVDKPLIKMVKQYQQERALSIKKKDQQPI